MLISIVLCSVEPKNHEKPLKLASDILGDEGYADICSWEQVFTIASRPPEHDFDHSDVVRIPSSRPFVGKSSSVHMSADTFGKSRFALFTDWAHRLLLMLAGLSSNVLSVAAAVMLVASVPIARFFFGDQWRFFAPILAGLFLVVWALHAISTLYLAHTKLNDAVISDSSEAQARPDPIRSGKTKQIKKKVSIQPVYSENDGIILPQYKSYPSSMDEQRPSSTGSKLGERLSFRLKAFTGGSLNLDTGSNPKPAVQAPPSASSPKHTRNRIASAFQGLFKGKAASNQVPTTNISPRATDPAASNATEGMSSRGRSISASSSLFFYKDGKEAANPVPDKQRQSIQWIPRSNIRESKEVVKEDQSPSPGRARGVSIPTERDRNDLDDDSIADEYVRASFDSFHGDTIKHDEDDPLHVDQA